MEYDVIIIGGGPAGLAAAIHLKQLCQKHGRDLSICILDKGSKIGAHTISGCIMDPRGLNELIPDWQNQQLPINTAVSQEQLLYLGKKSATRLPIPHNWSNHGNYIISLSQLCASLAEYAESLGVEVYPGFAASSAIIENGLVTGINSNDSIIKAKQIIIAEGCRGSLAKQIIKHYKLDAGRSPQTYGLGIKEIWQIDDALHQDGLVIHSVGYPLDSATYGGGFAYHYNKNLLSIGLVIGLDYQNPYLDPYEEFQKFKLQPKIQAMLLNGKRIEYGARTVVEGGLQALPKLMFPGGILVGDCAGFLNVAKIKGVHHAIKSGMLGAQAIFAGNPHNYPELFKNSWLYDELHNARNIRPGFQYGLYAGLLNAAVDQYLFRGRAPWTLKMQHQDYQCLQNKNQAKLIKYDYTYDNKITFDKASSLQLTNISYPEGQACHLKLINPKLFAENLAKYVAPETRYCPAGVYELIGEKLHINAQNCVHCKACDIKDPQQNIEWTVPEDGGGPQYTNN